MDKVLIDSSLGKLTGTLIGVVLLIVASISFWLLFTTPIALTTFLFGLLGSATLLTAVIVFNLTAALKNASYQFKGQTLELHWGKIYIRLPQQALHHFVQGSEQTITTFQGIRWPGHCLGRGQIIFEERPLPTLFLATGGVATQWFIITPYQAIAISPQNPDLLTKWLSQASSSTTAEVQTDLALWEWDIWSDGWYWALVSTAAGINLLLLALLCTIYPQLPTDLTAAQNLFLWPLLATASWLFNALLGGWFHQQRQEPFMAYLLNSGAVAIQVAALLITLNMFTS